MTQTKLLVWKKQIATGVKAWCRVSDIKPLIKYQRWNFPMAMLQKSAAEPSFVGICWRHFGVIFDQKMNLNQIIKMLTHLYFSSWDILLNERLQPLIKIFWLYSAYNISWTNSLFTCSNKLALANSTVENATARYGIHTDPVTGLIPLLYWLLSDNWEIQDSFHKCCWLYKKCFLKKAHLKLASSFSKSLRSSHQTGAFMWILATGSSTSENNS